MKELLELHRLAKMYNVVITLRLTPNGMVYVGCYNEGDSKGPEGYWFLTFGYGLGKMDKACDDAIEKLQKRIKLYYK